MDLEEIMALSVAQLVDEPAHLYLWVPNALLPEGFGCHEGVGLQLQIEYRLA
jgi:N6-adenosine-specific RNA methylase IME4